MLDLGDDALGLLRVRTSRRVALPAIGPPGQRRSWSEKFEGAQFPDMTCLGLAYLQYAATLLGWSISKHSASGVSMYRCSRRLNRCLP